MLRSCRPSSSASPAPPLDDEDLLGEILVRLPRAFLVCKRWRCLVSDPVFLRRFRAHHREPPVLGYFVGYFGIIDFFPIMDPPDRIPASRFSVPQTCEDRWDMFGCRHGQALLVNQTRHEAVVWDPLTGHQRRLSFPPGFDDNNAKMVHNDAVLCAAGDDHGHVHGDCRLSPFKLVLVWNDFDYNHRWVSACLYKSESGVWGKIISIATRDLICFAESSVLVGNALCLLLTSGAILEFDLDSQSLAVIERPADTLATHHSGLFKILRTEESGLALAILTVPVMEIWARKANSDGVIKWVVQKTVELDKLLSLESSSQLVRMQIIGAVEDSDAIILWTITGVFMIQIESMQFMKLSQSQFTNDCYPYKSLCAAGNSLLQEKQNPVTLLLAGM